MAQALLDTEHDFILPRGEQFRPGRRTKVVQELEHHRLGFRAKGWQAVGEPGDGPRYLCGRNGLDQAAERPAQEGVQDDGVRGRVLRHNYHAQSRHVCLELAGGWQAAGGGEISGQHQDMGRNGPNALKGARIARNEMPLPAPRLCSESLSREGFGKAFRSHDSHFDGAAHAGGAGPGVRAGWLILPRNARRGNRAVRSWFVRLHNVPYLRWWLLHLPVPVRRRETVRNYFHKNEGRGEKLTY